MYLPGSVVPQSLGIIFEFFIWQMKGRGSSQFTSDSLPLLSLAMQLSALFLLSGSNGAHSRRILASGIPVKAMELNKPRKSN